MHPVEKYEKQGQGKEKNKQNACIYVHGLNLFLSRKIQF